MTMEQIYDLESMSLQIQLSLLFTGILKLKFNIPLQEQNTHK